MSIYAQLLTLAAKSKHKRSWAEAFFPTTSARSTRDEPDEISVSEDQGE